MADVKVRDLRQNLPAYLARVQRGERLRVTSRGKPVAEIVRPPRLKRQGELRASVSREVFCDGTMLYRRLSTPASGT